MSNNLVFFDKEGHYLNFKYDEGSDTYNGDLIFHENGSDTFKTIGIYTFEKIPSFEFEDSLELEKFQLFNEYGINISSGKYINQKIDKIEAVNNDPTFKSKWIYGDNFESKFPLGSNIYFNSNLFEFTNILQVYTVVSSKKNAVMILSTMDNKTFNTNYLPLVGLTSSYDSKTVSGLNIVGINNYINPLTFDDNLSYWSEPKFYNLLYTGRKINLVNSQRNDGVLTIKNKNLNDNVYFDYYLTSDLLPNGSDLIIEVILKTDLPVIYSGYLNILSNKIQFGSQIPDILKPGIQFTIGGSIDNTNFISIGDIPTFTGNTQLTYYATYSQVIWNNLIYECLQSYTQSATSSINPNNTNYWTRNISYLPVEESLTPEVLSYGEIYLTTNKLYYGTTSSGSTQSNNPALTMAFAAEKYKLDLNSVNIDLFYNNKKITASLRYASNYSIVNFYHTKVGPTYSIGQSFTKLEKNIEVEELLLPEINKDISLRSTYHIIFNDIDDYGISININGLVYDQSGIIIYSGLDIDIERSIDKTIRAWVDKYYIILYRLGVSITIDYLVNYPYIYADSITLKSVYPNIPINFDVKVGTTANYYIQHSDVLFYDIGNVLLIDINGRNYSATFSQSDTVSEKLSKWTLEYSSILDDYGIYTSSINNKLIFNIKDQLQPLHYSIFIGKTPLPGENSYKITDRIIGNIGPIISSNAVIIGNTQSTFFDINGASAGNISFATGMITSVNNSIYPFNNQEYNLIEVNADRLVFSYQGPFWGGTTSLTKSPFSSIGFSEGFTYSNVPAPDSFQHSLGAFSSTDFDYSFSSYDSYIYDVITPDVDGNAISGIVDIIFINSSGYLYVLGTNIKIYDGLSGDFIDTLLIPSLSTSVKFLYNKIDGYLYVLSIDKIYKIDIFTNTIVDEYILTHSNAYDAIINPINGDIYISYSSNQYVEIFDILGTQYSVTPSAGTGTFKFEYNYFEGDIYVTTNANIVIKIDGTTRSQTSTYSISGLVHKMVYEPSNSSMYVMGSVLNQIDNGTVSQISSVSNDTFSDIIYDNISETIMVSLTSLYDSVNIDNSINYSLVSTQYGYLSINQYDQRIYLSSQTSNEVLIINPFNGMIQNKVTGLPSQVTKLIYNPLRGSMWGIMPSNNTFIEIIPDIRLNVSVYYPPSYGTYSNTYESLYGTLDSNYIHKSNIWIKTRDYIRKPRENFEGENSVQYVWKWLTDENPDIFLYDFSGNLLDDTGPYAYIGEKPLNKAYLNRYPNKDIGKTSSSESQQTIFDEVVYNIDYINSSYNLSYMPEPLEAFVGFNSQDEGVSTSTLLLVKREDIQFSIITNSLNLNNISFTSKVDKFGSYYGEISLDTNSTDNFISDENGNNRGLKVGQLIQISIKDNTNTRNKYLSKNNGNTFKIKEIYFKLIVVVPIYAVMNDEKTVVSNYPSSGKTTYLTTTIKVIDREIGRFYVSGQTEIEDIRYKTELGNAGKNITADDSFIFKSYDINEQGVDWVYLNSKRKEMLIVKDDIYPYVGSYKAIINAINFFGYNDLELYEYYRNINTDSKDFGKLFKVEIPDIFDNTVPGWKENDFIKHTMPNSNYEDTNLFNLTYNITDKEGNNVLLYSLPEVLIKLQGLKYWLQRNVIPISHRILDITGRADFVNNNSIVHKSYDAKIFNTYQSMSPYDFRINEAYLMPINSGSTVYNVIVDFYNEREDIIPDYFSLRIRTYKTYPEWKPFKYYSNGSIVSYYQQIYESIIDNNRLNDPRKYKDISSWNINFNYSQSQIVEYKRNYYEFIGTQSIINGTNSVNNPFVDVLNHFGNWKDITEWRKLDYVPVQTIKEFRTGTQSFNFTIDTNIDPFIVVEVTSDNGYGQNYTSKKNYELRSLLDIDEGVGELDEIGPIKVYNFLTSTTTSTTTTAPDYIILWEGIDPYCQDNTPSTTTTTTTTTTSTTTTTTTIASTTTTTSTTTTIIPCPVPTGFTASGGTSSITISWNNMGGVVTSYEVTIYKADTPGTPLSGYPLVTTSPHTFVGLLPGTNYWVYVRSLCNGNPDPDSNWNSILVSTQPLPTTTTTSTTTTSTTALPGFSFTIFWSAASDIDACTVQTNGVTVYSYTGIGLVNGDTYYNSNGTPFNGSIHQFWSGNGSGSDCGSGTIDSNGLYTKTHNCFPCL